MPPRLNLFATRTAVPGLRQSSAPCASQRCIASALRRSGGYGTKPTTTSLQSSVGAQRRWNSSGSEKKDLEEAQRQATSMPHVSEEAAEINKIMEKEKRCDGTPSSPELQQGTMVSEILQRDKEAQKHAPQVFQDQIKKSNGSRSFSTSARRGQVQNQGASADDGLGAEASAALVESMISQVTAKAADLELASGQLPPGLKFEAPETLPWTENYKKRYEPLLDQFTKNLMRDGKLATAQRNMSFILDYLRSAPPPMMNPKRRLLNSPPASQLSLDPVLYLTLIVDSVAPVIKLRNQKGIAGGGASVQVPAPLAERQRRRTAIRWIIDASDKRRDSRFAQRVAAELVSVAEGRSSAWEKREHAHKLAVAGRASVGLTPRKK
ncbi:ribosomal protein S7 domain-containing protein [Aspergillus californicus]